MACKDGRLSTLPARWNWLMRERKKKKKKSASPLWPPVLDHDQIKVISLYDRLQRTATTVVTTTITPSPVEALLRQQYAAENGREPAQGDDVPMYAWPCDVDRYAEVCSCLGFPATTITELAWTAIETLTLIKTPQTRLPLRSSRLSCLPRLHQINVLRMRLPLSLLAQQAPLPAAPG
ncbi:hypothetical protein BKA80DRAFT_78637 [Phyllosticta citrichinensis]